MRSTYGMLTALLTLVAQPAYADELFAVTPSGAAEMMFAEGPSSVVGKLSSQCMTSGWTVITSSGQEVVCESPMNVGQSILGQVLLGNSYSTPPRRFFRFNVAAVNGVSRVQASGWMELQMAFGQMKRNDFTGPEFQNSIMSFLANAGGKYPAGTTFPNHVLMGFDSNQVMQGKYMVLNVTDVVAGFPAHGSGMQSGDIVIKVAGKRFRHFEDYLDATAKAAKTPTYEVELVRGGKPMKLTLQRAFRPSVTGSIVTAQDSDNSSAPENRGSVADELAKLAKLKTDGVITEEEFTDQKKKVLQR